MRLAGKSAIVTGGGNGIGRAVAETFAREGCRVIVADIDATGATEAVEAIRQSGGEARARVLDVTRPDDIAATVGEAVQAFGRLDVMVNNAGVPAGEWQHTIDVNLSGVLYGVRYAAEAMATAGGSGSIINTASVAGLAGIGGPAGSGADAYVASKHGIIGVTREYALAYGPRGVRVNCVCPGWTETDFIKNLMGDESWRRKIIAGAALRRVATPQEIANMFLFLASDESSFVTGATMVVDGGWTAA